MRNLNDKRVEGLRALCGHVQNSSFETVTFSQDDATHTWHLTVGTKRYWSDSFYNVLDDAIADMEHDNAQAH